MTKIRNLLLELKNNSIDVLLSDGELEVFYDGEDLDPIIYNQIKENKHELIQFLKSNQRDEDSYFSIPSAPSQVSYPLSSSQYRLWVVSQFAGGNAAYNIPGVYEFEGSLDVELIESSFKFLIERHESLRTIFKEDDQGEVRQYILEYSDINFKIEYKDLQSENGLEADAINITLEEELKKPFSLSEGLLIRVKLLQITEYKFFFSLVMHHIISDGWSMEIMIKELFAFYKSSMSGKSYSLAPLRIQYRDYSVWQQEKLKGDQLEKFKQYWLTQLADDIPILALPSQKQRPAIKTYNGATLDRTIDKHLLKKLKELSQSKESTLFMSLLSLVKVLFYRYTYQEDIIIGSAIAGREHPDLGDQVGFFINTLPLRTRFGKDDNFISLLKKVREVALGAYEHQIYPLDGLLGDLSLKRDMSRNALFDVMVDLQSRYDLAEEVIDNQYVENFTIKPYAKVKNTKSRFDLHFNFSETSDGLHINLTYNTDIYSDNFVIQMLNHLEQILEQIIIYPSLPISQLEYLNKTEKEQLLVEFNDTEVNYPKNKTIVDLFEEQVAKAPNNVAVVFEEVELTYKELNEKSNQLASYLRENHAIGPDDLVGIKLQRSEQLIIAIFGILKAGAAYVPIDINYPQERITYIEEDSQFKVVLDEEKIMLYNLERFRYEKKNHIHENNLSNLAYVTYTSGSTGHPKGVMIEHKSLYNYLKWCSEFYFEKDEEGDFGLFSSLSFDLTVTSIFLPLIRGNKIRVIENDLDIYTVLTDYISKSARLDSIKLTPSHLELLKDLDLNGIPLKRIIVGGESLLRRQINPILSQKKELIIYNEYGPTESTVGCMVKEINKDSLITIGKPISNTQIYLLDDDLQLVPIGVSGKLYISGAGLARGYLNKPELTVGKFVCNPFLEGERMYDTGDLGRWLPSGDIEFLGRKDQQVKIRGFRIELGEIESAISQYSEDLQQVVVEAKENNQEKFLVAYLVSTNIDKSGLKNFLKDKLPDFMIPSFYVELEELPLTQNGKIDRKALPSVAGEDIIRKEYVGPRNQTEEKLVAIWQEVLGVKKIGITDNFFELGGNSLKLIRLSNEIERKFNKKIIFSELYEKSILTDQVEMIKKDSPDISKIKAIGLATDYTITKAQERIWIASQDDDGSIAHNMPFTYIIAGEIVVDKLQQAYDLVLYRHEILRTAVFVDQKHQLRQLPLSVNSINFQIQVIDLKSENLNEGSREVEKLIENVTQQRLDISNGKVLNVTLIQLSETKTILHQVLHHIAGDEWSIIVMINDMLLAYSGLTSGITSDIFSPLEIQYKDYAAWETDLLETSKNLKKFWKKQFFKSLPSLDLPIDYHKDNYSNKGSSYLVNIDQEESVFLKKIKEKHQISNSVLFASLIYVLFYKYTGNKDFLIGFIFTQREGQQLVNQIGPYINILPVRLNYGTELTFNKLLEESKNHILDVISFGKFPTEYIRENIHPKSSDKIQIDLNIMNNVDVLPSMLEGTKQLTFTPIKSGYKSSKFPICIYVYESEATFNINIEYQVEMFRHSKIKLLGELFITILKEFLNNPEKNISSIKLYNDLKLPAITKLKR